MTEENLDEYTLQIYFKGKKTMGKKCCKSRKKLFVTFQRLLEGIKCQITSKIKMLADFKVANYWMEEKIQLKMHLTEQKTCDLLPQRESCKRNFASINSCNTFFLQISFLNKFTRFLLF